MKKVRPDTIISSKAELRGSIRNIQREGMISRMRFGYTGFNITMKKRRDLPLVSVNIVRRHKL